MNKRLLFIAGATTLLSAAVVVTSFFATNRNFASTNAGPYIDPDPDPIEVVTLTTLTYDDFDFGKLENYTDFWVTSPNGNKIGIYLGGNPIAIGGEQGHGELTLTASNGNYVDTRELTTDPSARKYAFSQIKSVSISFTGADYLEIEYRDEFIVSGHIWNNSELNLNNSDFFKIYPSSGSVTITSIRVTYNSTGDFCN